MKALVGLSVALFVVIVLIVGAVGIGLVRTGPDAATQARGPVDVTIEDLRFTPNRLDARVGVPLVVRLTNRGLERHDMNFPSLHMPGLEGVESILAPGETRTITLLFDRPGTHTFICSLPGHAAAGMTGAVFVQS